MIAHIVGARPQFIKLLPLYRALGKEGAPQFIIHTGQHWEKGMSDVFFNEFGIKPDKVFKWDPPLNGEIVSLKMLDLLKSHLSNLNPDTVVVYGDTNSTILGAVSANMLKLPLAHVEAGLRGFNTKMPEESCRVNTDLLSDWHFAPSRSAILQLKREGLDRGKSHTILSGDIMLDALKSRKEKSFSPGKILITLHRNINVDDEKIRNKIIKALEEISNDYQLIWPIHPRLRQFINANDWPKNINCIDPLSHGDLINELEDSEWVITDSGGLQKEAYFLQKPCIVLRSETEWKELLDTGNSFLIDQNEYASSEKMSHSILKIIRDYVPREFKLIYGDGNAAKKIAKALWVDEKSISPNSLTLNGDENDNRLIFAGEIIRRITGIKLSWRKNGMSWPKSNLWASNEGMELWTNESDFLTSDMQNDYLALIAYGASRSEEWNSKSLDEHGRFNGENYCRSFLDKQNHPGIPELHVLAEKFIQYFRPEFTLESRDSPPITLVVDIDHLYAFKGFSMMHRSLGFIIDLISGKWRRLKARFDEIDPFDSIENFIGLKKTYSEIRFQFFAWIGPKRSEFDRGPSIVNKTVKVGIRKIFKHFPSIGIHPTYSGHDLDSNWLKTETNVLVDVLGQKIVRSRFHYLRMSIPETYTALDRANIQEDWSLEYPNKPGYRAGLGVPFPVWFGAEKGAIDNYGLPYLTWVPVAVMDQNLIDLTPNEIISFLQEWKTLANRYGAGLAVATHWRLFGPNMNMNRENRKYINWLTGINDYLKSTKQ
tara:strand:+ start:487 stop:2793 length:2307 start_codon:yes stop_codon:yes gene_type:complete